MKVSVAIDIVPQGRPRFYNGVVYDPPKSRRFKKDLALIVKSLVDSPCLGELKVRIDVYRKRSKFKKGVTSKNYGDADNLEKIVLDALKEVCWQDDSQIGDLRITKNLADEPRIDIEVGARYGEEG